MRITPPAAAGLPPMDPCGWLVLRWERHENGSGEWVDDWDGRVHTTEAAGWNALAEARDAEWTVVLVRAEPVAVVDDA